MEPKHFEYRITKNHKNLQLNIKGIKMTNCDLLVPAIAGR